MIAHHILSMGFMIYLSSDLYLFEDRSQAVIEIGSEFLLHFLSVLLSQYNRLSYSYETKLWIE